MVGATLIGIQAFAGDFSNPVPYSVNAQRASRISNENMRLFGGMGSASVAYSDNNSVVLTLGGSTITQTSNNGCLSTTNTFLNNGGTAEMLTIDCGTVP